MVEGILFPAGMYALNGHGLLNLICAGIILACTLLVVAWEAPGRLRTLFIIMGIAMTGWQAWRGLASFAVDDAYRLFWFRTSFLYAAILLPLLYHYVVIVISIADQRRRIVALNWLIFPVFGATATASTSFITGLTSTQWGSLPQFGIAGNLMLGYLVGLVVLAALDARLMWQQSSQRSHRRRVRYIAIGLIMLFCGTVDWFSAAGLNVYPFGGVTVAVFMVMMARLTRKHGLSDASAQLSPQRLLEVSRDAMLIVDTAGLVREANPAAVQMFAVSTDELLNQPVESITQSTLHREMLSSLVASQAEDAEITMSDPHSGEDRHLSVAVSPVRDGQGGVMAYVCDLRDMTSRRQAEAERHHDSLHDYMTGLLNRYAFVEFVRRAVVEMRDGRRDYSMLALGIDRFRVINEELGSAAGDHLLKEIASRLLRSARDGDIVARVGGDEFAVLLSGTSSSEDIRSIAARMQAALQEPFELAGQEIFVSVSMGFAHSEPDIEGSDDILRNALRAMYNAKQNGGGVIAAYLRDTRAAGRIAMEADIRRGIANGEFVAHYQPIVSVDGQHLVGFEALARWEHPERGMVSPAEFIDLAESLGLIADIGRCVSEQACHDLVRFQQEMDNPDLYVSVNISDAEFSDEGFVSRIISLIQKHGLEPENLRLEITERMVMLDPGDTRLAALKRAGFHLFIDDFGTGYSSMSRLHDLPVTTLKIDRSFVQAMARKETGHKVVKGILDLARGMGFNVIAEGVAELSDHVRLDALGCPYAQGFYYARPVSAGDILSHYEAISTSMPDLQAVTLPLTASAACH